jgi:hypothetical protein
VRLYLNYETSASDDSVKECLVCLVDEREEKSLSSVTQVLSLLICCYADDDPTSNHEALLSIVINRTGILSDSHSHLFFSRFVLFWGSFKEFGFDRTMLHHHYHRHFLSASKTNALNLERNVTVIKYISFEVQVCPEDIKRGSLYSKNATLHKSLS